jgi:DNA sulfur modification protein DndB
MEARFLVNDGQHRLAAIMSALRQVPSIANDTISVVLYADAGLARSQQMFADLNRYAVRPPKSLGILYDHRDPMARLVWHLVDTVPVFKGMTETARSTISNRSRKLFTLSSIYQATRKLLGKRDRDPVSSEEEAAAEQFWNEVARNMPDWSAAVDRQVNPSDLRATFVHAHGVALQAIATAGQALLAADPKGWRRRLAKLKDIDWSRSNTRLWEGRALIGGRLSKAEQNVVLTANAVKTMLGLPLGNAERKVEDFHETGRDRRSGSGRQNNAHQGKPERPDGADRKAIPRRRTSLGDRLQRG